MIRRLHSCLAALVLLAAAGGPGPAFGQGKKNGTTAQISIRVIYAVKEKAASVDPALEDIKGELTELPFSKFRLLDRLQAKVVMGGAVELEFPGDRSIAVQFLGLANVRGKRMLSLSLAIKPAAKIQLRVTDGGRTLLVGPRHKDGKLILDIAAKVKEASK